ncbi:MAG: NAD(P)-dependent oxidoreductase [Candidatus Latescibacterota bacterium]|nr:NAD(P)-dependent oxidoreductase [Candidatus Latescibacterota bacterium]
MADKMKVLVTGAAGLVGGHLRTHWGDRYMLRLADIAPVEDLAAHEEFVEMDITDYDAFLAVCQGVDAVVHLAADPSMEAEFYQTLLPLNIIGCYNGFEAAREAGCQRIVFASSINAILGYGREGEPVPWDAPVYPINVYGATKCVGEALGRSYAHQHGLSCIMVRIGGAAWRQGPDQNPVRSEAGITARDQAQLFARCLEAPAEVDFKIVHGTSNHTRQWMDLEVSRELGYEPEDGTAMG